MTIIESEQIIPCDIDSTLLMWGHEMSGGRYVWFTDPYEEIDKRVLVNTANLKVFEDRLVRGATILVWSASGYLWSKAAMNALNINHKNVVILGKPVGYIDDKPCQDWMGPRIFLAPDDKWGEGL